MMLGVVIQVADGVELVILVVLIGFHICHQVVINIVESLRVHQILVFITVEYFNRHRSLHSFRWYG
ncbi:hypothetical protein D3C76_1794500 [compost metagenome]